VAWIKANWLNGRCSGTSQSPSNRDATDPPPSHVNGDGLVDFSSYLEFLDQFDAGC